MSDDLTERLRDRRVCSPAQNSCRNDYICDLAADRIEELEAVIDRQHKRAETLAEGWRIADDARIELEAKMAMAVEGFEKIARLGNGDRYGNSDGNVIAQKYIAELKGETDD